MYNLRNNPFYRKVEKAVARLKASRSPVGQFTARMIESAKVRIFPFYKFSPQSLDCVAGLEGKFKTPKRFTRSELNKIRKQGVAFYSETVIHIDHRLTEAQIISVLVHEVNHYLNDVVFHEPYNTPRQQFMHEYKAYLATSLYKSNMRVTRAKANTIAKEVAEDYKWPLPKRLPFPKQPFYI